VPRIERVVAIAYAHHMKEPDRINKDRRNKRNGKEILED
jgi:hypothetical protein